MATGDKELQTRPRAESNQRLDLVEFDALAITSQLSLEAAIRALLSSPKATAGLPVGERWTGSLTANPTSASDGLFRVDTPPFIGVDANGGFVLKRNSIALAASIPAGGADYQVYLHMKDVAEDTQVRRKLPATAPFTEFSAAINVALRQTCDIYVRAGNAASVVAQDVVAGQTRPLLFLGIATNTGGAVVFTPAANTLETVTQPASVPASSTGITTAQTTVTGEAATLRQLTNVALYKHGIGMWKGSRALTPSAANNYGAYVEPVGGVDAAFKQALGHITIGDGVSVFGDFNVSEFASCKLLMDAAILALPTEGGIIVIKSGVQLSDFDGALVALPALKTVMIVGDHDRTPETLPQFTFIASEGFECNNTGKFILCNLHIRHVTPSVVLKNGPLTVRDVFFEGTSTTDQGAAIQNDAAATACKYIDIERVLIATNQSGPRSTAFGVRIANTATTSLCRIVHVEHRNYEYSAGTIGLGNIGSNVEIGHIYYRWLRVGAHALTLCPVVKIDTTDNTDEIRNRWVHHISLDTAIDDMVALTYGNTGYLVIEALQQGATIAAFGHYMIYQSGFSSSAGPVVFRDCTFERSDLAGFHCHSVTIPDLSFENCKFGGPVEVFGSTLTRVRFDRCTFNSINNVVQASSTIHSLTVNECWFKGIGNASSPDFSALKVVATTSITSVVFTNNHIDGFQNVNYIGADAVISPRVFEVDANFVSAVVCNNNTLVNVLNNSSGNARRGAYLLNLSSTDRTTGSMIATTINISNNQLGRDNDFVGLLQTSLLSDVSTLNISNNVIQTTWFSTTVVIDHLVSVLAVGSGAIIRNLLFTNNHVYVENPLNTAMVSGVLDCVNGGALTWYNVQITNNAIWMASVTGAWDVAGGIGFRLVGMSIVNVTVQCNSASRPTTSGTEFIRTNFGTVTRTSPSGGKPAAGVAWGNNNMIHSNG
jgi:hypothetical protein